MAIDESGDSSTRRTSGRGRLVERRQWIVELRQGVRLALRSYARAPIFTAALVLTLGIGAGANGAVLSILRATLLHPLPYRDPERLVMVWDEPVAIPAPDHH